MIWTIENTMNQSNIKLNQNRRSTMKVLQIFLIMALASVIALTGCSKDNITDPGDDFGEGENGNNNGNNNAQLNFYEEELLGLWSRYHSYDGSTMYVYFNADRTACKWEEESGSNYRQSESSYSHWYIDENDANNGVVTVIFSGSQYYFRFDYPADEIWPLSYNNLTYYPSSGKTCE